MEYLIELGKKYNQVGMQEYTINAQYTIFVNCPKKISMGILQQAKGDCPDWVLSDQMVLGKVRREDGPRVRLSKTLREIRKQLYCRKAKGPSQQQSWWQTKKGQLALSQGKMKKGDNVAEYEEDDAVRTSVSQDQVTVTRCAEELFLRTQYP
jgi:hypothetical protein